MATSNITDRPRRRNDAEACALDTPSGTVTLLVSSHAQRNYARRSFFPKEFALVDLQRNMKKLFTNAELARRCLTGEEEVFALKYGKTVYVFEVWKDGTSTEVYLNTYWEPAYQGELFHVYPDITCLETFKDGRLVIGLDFIEMDQNWFADYSHKAKSRV